MPTAKTAHLKPHPLSEKIYGVQEPLDGLTESIAQHGVLAPIIVTANQVIVSGHRRWRVACDLGLAEVPVEISPLADPLEIELAVIEANRQREKSNEQKAREVAERLRIESALADQRRRQGADRGRTSQRQRREAAARPEEEFPQAEPTARGPQARDLAGAPLGWSGRTAEKAVAVVEYADRTGDHEVLELMNRRSVDSAYAAVKQKTGDGPKPPPFTPQYTNVWVFPGPTPGIGQAYPGQIPGDVVRNLCWLYTRSGDLVVDPFAGGGVTMDAVAWWNEQRELWPLRQVSTDLVPSSKGIRPHDVTQSPCLPAEFRGAGLVFLDPPYWRQKRGEYSDHATNLANLTLNKFNRALLRLLTASRSALRAGGHVGLIIGATQHEGEFMDHAAFVLGYAERLRLKLTQRVIVVYTSQQFSGANVAQARKSRMLLNGYRDLMIFEALRQ